LRRGASDLQKACRLIFTSLGHADDHAVVALVKAVEEAARQFRARKAIE
jgi:hypothetical protein